MKVCATQLMKELKALQGEIYDIYQDDDKSSVVPADQKTLEPKYTVEYDYEKNRKKLVGLYARERKVRHALSVFNSTQRIDGYDITIEEGLVMIAQLRKEIGKLTTLASKSKFSNCSWFGEETINKVTYDIDRVKKDLEKKQSELSALQVAIDRTNLTVMFEI